jgi:cobalt-zinc-cadmium resistance protein CzcA
VIIVENSLRRLAERQHALGRVLTLDERLREVAIAAKEMVQPSVYGQAIIVTVYIPLLALTGVAREDVPPDGDDGHLRACSRRSSSRSRSYLQWSPSW